MKNLFFGLIATVLFTNLSFGQNIDKSENQVTSKQVEQLLLKKYGLIKANSSSVNLSEVSINDKSITDENVTIYHIEDSSVMMIVIPNNENPNKITLVKGTNISGKFKEEKLIEVISVLDKNGNGSISVYNFTDNLGFTSKFINYKITENEFVSNTNELQSRTLCQRQNGETFNACFNRESTEFCDGFVSTVAYITNPSIAVLIAALCSC